MSNVVLAGLVKTAVAELVNEQKPFNVATVISTMVVPDGTVIDVDFIEMQVSKLFYTDGLKNYDVFLSVNGDAIYAPENTGKQTPTEDLSLVGKSVPQRHIYNLVYSPDSRGRIRFPVRLTSTVQKTDSNKVWIVTNGDEIRVSAHKPRSASKPKQYTIDCYGNILLKAPADSTYEMRTGRHNTLVAKPVTM
jgi:hypothetical protein